MEEQVAKKSWCGNRRTGKWRTQHRSVTLTPTDGWTPLL